MKQWSSIQPNMAHTAVMFITKSFRQIRSRCIFLRVEKVNTAFFKPKLILTGFDWVLMFPDMLFRTKLVGTATALGWLCLPLMLDSIWLGTESWPVYWNPMMNSVTWKTIFMSRALRWYVWSHVSFVQLLRRTWIRFISIQCFSFSFNFFWIRTKKNPTAQRSMI